MSATLRVMSFNVRYAAADDGENRWSLRRARVIRTIRAFVPDLLATQEVLAEQLDYMREHLAEYVAVAAGREDGSRRGEAVAVFYRADRFEICEETHFWLSETPQLPGSRSWGASQPRMVTGCHLRDRSCEARQLWFLNTHFDHRSEEARTKSALMLRRRVDQLPADVPCILAGDFNATEQASVHGILLRGDNPRQPLIDAHRAVHPVHDGNELTRHGFQPTREGSRIDWILHSPQFRAEQSDIVRTRVDDGFPSDHYPVVAVLSW